MFQALYPTYRTVERAVKETMVCSTFPCVLSGKLMSYSLSTWALQPEQTSISCAGVWMRQALRQKPEPEHS